jgi:DNA-binding response OmpR family regulator
MDATLRGCTILIVEDEPLIGFAIADVIRNEGGEVVGPVVTCAQAMGAMSGRRIDGAILDVMLRDETTFGLADALLEQRIPVVFVTGHVEELIPTRFQCVPILVKPFVTRILVSALKAAIRREDSSDA